jgi:hypothetical protein
MRPEIWQAFAKLLKISFKQKKASLRGASPGSVIGLCGSTELLAEKVLEAQKRPSGAKARFDYAELNVWAEAHTLQNRGRIGVFQQAVEVVPDFKWGPGKASDTSGCLVQSLFESFHEI